MRPSLYGRIVFGGSAVLFGVIALMWHDPETWQNLSEIWKLPFGTIAGQSLMAVLAAAGIALIFARIVRPASIVLAIVYALFSLICIGAIVAAPKVFAQYGSFFEQFALVCGALAAYAATSPNSAPIARAARLGLGVCAISFTLGQIVYFRFTAELVPAWIPPNQTFWAGLTTVAFALTAFALLINRQARLATRLMTLMLGIFAVLVWIPRLVARPQAHLNWSEFALTVLIAGASWMVAGSVPPSGGESA